MKYLIAVPAALLLSGQALALSLSDLTESDAGKAALSTLTAESSSNADLSSVTESDATTALKDALVQGAKDAVTQLGQSGGFSNDEDVRIELPFKLNSATQLLGGLTGMDADFASLETGMNEAAEAAMPEAAALLVSAVQNMTITDAKDVLAGEDDAATAYLEKSSREQLREKFLPLIKERTDQFNLAQQYNALAGQAKTLGAPVTDENASVESYVTEKALDGLFTVLAEEEASIRENPEEAATALAQKIFGLL